MNDIIESIAVADETPEADAIEQHLIIDLDGETRLDTAWVSAVSERYANEADVVDQAIIIPLPDDTASG